MELEISDWDELKCPLPVARYVESDDGWSEGHVELAICEEPLFVNYRRDEVLQRVGQQDVCGTSWRVECQAQHVLLLPDYGASDNLDLIRFDRALLDQVLLGRQ